MQSALGGEARAERAIWNQYASLVRRIVSRSLGPEYDIEDVVQEVFMHLFDRLAQLRDPSALRSYLVAICVHRVRSHVRRRRVRRIIGFSAFHDLQDLREVSVDYQSREVLLQFYRALEQLRTRDRMAFTLRYVEGMELTEVAAALEVSVPTVRRILAHASERLGTIVKSSEPLASYLARRA
ncbi:MAG: sigma-70 family RNA polymerase sigma factor [Myxococcales bacterium]